MRRERKGGHTSNFSPQPRVQRPQGQRPTALATTVVYRPVPLALVRVLCVMRSRTDHLAGTCCHNSHALGSQVIALALLIGRRRRLCAAALASVGSGVSPPPAPARDRCTLCPNATFHFSSYFTCFTRWQILVCGPHT